MATSPQVPPPPLCSRADQLQLIALAREAIEAALEARGEPHPPEVLTPILEAPSATFVTLTLRGKLRGCVGNLVAREALYRSVMNNAVGAALRDTRFDRVNREDFTRLAIQISILTPLVPLRFETPDQLLDLLTPGRDGVVLKHSARTATYLPQVWEKLTGKEMFLDSLCRKAGWPAGTWRQPGTEVSVYRVLEFGSAMGT